MADVLGVDRCRARLEAGRVLSPAQRRRFLRLVRLAGRRLPLAYVLGHADFLGLRLEVRPGVLCPRPETEELALAAASRIEGSGAGSALDIGTGTGCLAVSLAKRFPGLRVTATDVSPLALALARRNAARHGVSVRFLRHDLFQPFPCRGFDLVVSNPPYVPTRRLERLSPEVRSEPRLALDGGADGLDAIRGVVRAGRDLLNERGILALEMDRAHAMRVTRLLEGAGFSGIEVLKDLQGEERIVLGTFMGTIV